MRPFPHPQCTVDWLTQYWNILLGRRAHPERDAWLLGPVGSVGGVGEKIIGQLAAAEGLAVERSATAGLLGSPELFHHLGAEVRPEIVAFYTRTSEFQMDAWTKWEPVWGGFGRLVDRIFARRVDQLRLPADPLATSQGITSEIVRLTDPPGVVRHTLWLRKLVSTGTVIYAGFYYHVIDPTGTPRVKVVFPLPHGNATVIMGLSVLPGGGVRLASRGTRDGEPGFYFVVEDRRGGRWVHYLRAFHEYIDVTVDAGGDLRADHRMLLWGRRVYSLHYRVRRSSSTNASPQRQVPVPSYDR